VRNTVDEAIAAFVGLVDAGLDATLFHARFAMGDRLDIEADVLERFGRDRAARFPNGAVLVATQVVEQSLDLDFDLVVTDLAPIDLLIQRAGRLWRHMDKRPTNARPIDGPRLLVVSPAPIDDAPANWISRALPGTSAVYRDPTILWASAKALMEAGAIITSECAAGSAPEPGSMRWLIEAVYGHSPWALPPALVAAVLKAEGERNAARAQAGHSVLSVWEGYGGENQPWDDDSRVRTRLGDDTLTLRLGVVESDEIVPFYQRSPMDEPARAWALSEVTVGRRESRASRCLLLHWPRRLSGRKQVGRSTTERRPY
jgi:CRISPR-associated endonuclease/helicase Cas3